MRDMKIFITGFMGSGKTSIGLKLAGKCAARFIDMDDLIERQSGKTITEIFRSQGEAVFREMEKEVLTQVIRSSENLVVATGGGTACFFGNMEVMNQNGTTVYIKVSTDMLFERLRNEVQHRPLLATQKNIKEYIATSLAERESYYQKAQVIIDVKPGDTDEDVCNNILGAIQNKKEENL